MDPEILCNLCLTDTNGSMKSELTTTEFERVTQFLGVPPKTVVRDGSNISRAELLDIFRHLTEHHNATQLDSAIMFRTFCNDKTWTVSAPDVFVMVSLGNLDPDVDIASVLPPPQVDHVTFSVFIDLCEQAKIKSFPAYDQFNALFSSLAVANGNCWKTAEVGFITPEDALAALRCIDPTLTHDDMHSMFPPRSQIPLVDFIRGSVLAPRGALDLSALEQYVTAFTFFDRHQDGFIAIPDVVMVLKASGVSTTNLEVEKMLSSVCLGGERSSRVEFMPYIRLLGYFLHNHNTRMTSLESKRKQTICGECEKVEATIECETCNENYCKPCCDVVHSKGRRKQHSRFMKIVSCGECNVMQAVVKCRRCKEVYCSVCVEEVHSKGNRKLHVRHGDVVPISSIEFRIFRFTSANGFDINVLKDLVWSRFEGKPEISDATEVVTGLMEELKICKDFVDTTNCTSNAEMKESLHAWRRPNSYQPSAALFMHGNRVLGMLPHPGLWTPTPYWCSYLVKFCRGGALKDEWFLFALAMVTTNLSLFNNLIVSAEFFDVGAVMFQFNASPSEQLPCGHSALHKFRKNKKPCVLSPWSVVVTDTMLPCQVNGSLLFGTVHDRRELWCALLEKAYAKFLGGFDKLEGGDTATAVQQLTGGVVHTEQWDCSPKEDASPVGRVDDIDYLWWKISLATRNGLLVGLSYDPMKREGDTASVHVVDSTSSIQWSQCVQVLHAIQIVTPGADMGSGIRGKFFPTGPRLMKLRSVYGEVHHTGDWSDNSRTWTSQLRRMLSHKEMDEYVSWMCIEDVMKKFNTVVVCANCPTWAPAEIPRTYFGTLQRCTRNRTVHTAQQYFLEVKEPTNILRPADLCLQVVRQSRTPSKVYNVRESILNIEVPPLHMEDESDDDVGADEPPAITSGGVQVLQEGDQPQLAPSTAPSISRPTFTVHIHVYVNPTRSQRDKFLHNAVLELSMYRMAARTLQPILHGTDERSLASSFAFHNKLDLSAAEHGATDGPLHYYATAPLTIAGNFVVAITSLDSEEEIQYCLLVSEKDDEMTPLHFTTKLEPLGSHETPMCELSREVGVR